MKKKPNFPHLSNLNHTVITEKYPYTLVNMKMKLNYSQQLNYVLYLQHYFECEMTQ